MNGATATFGGLSLIVLLFLVFLAILWFILPFAIFGTKHKLDGLLHELKKSNEQLETLPERIAAAVAAKRESRLGPAATVPIESEHKKKPVEEVGLARKQVMEKYGISFDGVKYSYRNYRYDVFADAVAYAQKQTLDSKEP
jgi:hypothetical protein